MIKPVTADDGPIDFQLVDAEGVLLDSGCYANLLEACSWAVAVKRSAGLAEVRLRSSTPIDGTWQWTINQNTLSNM